MKLIDWITKVYPLLIERLADKMEATVDEGEVKAYWAGTIIRIDIKPSI